MSFWCRIGWHDWVIEANYGETCKVRCHHCQRIAIKGWRV